MLFMLHQINDMTLMEMIVKGGEKAVDSLPKGLRESETIQSNVRKLIIDEMAVNPKYYEGMPIFSMP